MKNATEQAFKGWFLQTYLTPERRKNILHGAGSDQRTFVDKLLKWKKKHCR